MSSDIIREPSVRFADDVHETILNTFIKAFKKICILLIIYLVGFYEFSIVWAGLIFLIIYLNEKWHLERENKRDIARAMALGFEKEILLNGLPEMPSWVTFPEIEKVEWLNRVFKLIWERFNLYIHDLVPKILEPAVRAYVSGFKFEKVVLGNVPLRVDGVKVYEQDSSNKIVMDLDISYAGDCYVTFQTYKFTGGIKDIQLHGRLRVVLTPLISKLPIIGGIQVYFMNEPRIDFDLIKVTQILDVPVIRNKIKNITMEVIKSMFLFPNIYSVKLSEGVNMSRLTVFGSEGILRVHVVEAKNLVNKDIIGKSDPYTVLSIGSMEIETEVIQNSLNPKWDFWHEFDTESNSELKIHVWDRDEGSKDETLGHAKIDISQVVEKGQDDQWIRLQDVVQGTIHIRFTWLTLSTDYVDLDAAMKEAQLLSPALHTALLMIYLDSSQNLPSASSPPSPLVELQCEQTIKTTEVVKNSCNPVWDKGFTYMIRDPRRAILDVRIFDSESEGVIGDFSYKVDNIKKEPNLEFRQHQFLLNPSNSKASISCSMKLRIFKNENLEDAESDTEAPKSPKKGVRKQDSSASNKSKISVNNFTFNEETESALSENDTIIDSEISEKESGLGNIKLSLSYSEQRQRLIVEVHEIEKLPYKNSSDSYVRLCLETDKSKTKKKTKTAKNTPHPKFDQTFEFLISSRDLTYSRLTVVATGEKRLLRKKFMGQVVIDLRNCADFTEPLTDWFNLKRRDDTDVYYLKSE